MANVGGLKAAAKRTAFGDVSNTANSLRPSKDDSATTIKGEGILENFAPLKADQNNVSLLRPAHRPISVGLKGLLNSVTNTSTAAPAKQPLAEVQPTQPTSHVGNTRKVLTKKSTAVFKDDVSVPAADRPVSDLPKPLPSTAPIHPVHRALQSQHLQQQEREEPEPKLRRTKSKAVVDAPSKKAVGEPLIVTIPSEEPAAVRSDGLYIDDRGEIQLYQFTDELDPPQGSLHAIDEGVALPSGVVPKTYITNAEKHPSAGLDPVDAPKMQPPPQREQQLIPVSEPEEYWDEEEDEENCGEEGYVTARSCKSRGENTTSGATTVLFPKANQKTRKELAAATALMDAAKAAGELDDETWDTTMVAEYGDEIFQYMRELEVTDCTRGHE